MTTRNADVNLIVRARTEGEKAISNLGDILDALFDDARSGASDIATLGKTLGALDKAAQSITGSMNKAGAAIDRQRASLAESNAAYAALLAQQAEAQRILDGFGNQAAKDFVGPRTKAFTEQYAGVRAEVDRLDAAITSLFNKITQQNAQLNGTQSSLIKLSSSATAVAHGQAEAEAQIELTTRALREQGEAAERVTDIQRRINAATGVDRPDATGSAARSAEILAAADAEFRRVEAVRADEAAQRALNNQLAERANIEATLERNTGLGRARATDSGATYSALTDLVNREYEAAQAIEQMDLEAAQLRATLDPLAAIQDRYNTQLARFKELAGAGRISANELAAAEEHLAIQSERARQALAGNGSSGGGSAKLGLFGLKPYELQNLSYQVNDVVTQLASGTSLAQTLGQQGGQILQLFPKFASSLVGALANPAIAALVVTVGAIALGLKEAADEAARLREYSAQTTFRADGGTYDPTQLAAAEVALKRIGASADDARAAVKTFLSEGLNPELLAQFGRAAQETAEVMGVKLPEAAKMVADAFTGGYQAVADLDDKLNFLTAAERDHIKQLFEEGNAEAARTEALNAYTRQADAAAAKQRGPWGEAARSLSTAWNGLLKIIGESLPVKIAIGVLDELAASVKALDDAINHATNASPNADTARATQIADTQKQINELRTLIAHYEDLISKKSPISGTLQLLVDASKKQLADAEKNLARLEKTAPSTLSNDPNSVAAKQRKDQLEQISTEAELQRLRDAGQQRLLSAQEQARRAQLAGNEAAKNANDSAVAAALKQQAVAHETAQIEKESDARRKAAAADREREIRQFEGRVVGAEGGAGKNPFSSAQGYGQFTSSTWLEQFAKTFPQDVSRLSRDQILGLRNNEQIARAVIDNYARENAKFLESFGAKVTAGNLYLTHFLGAAGAKAVLTAPNDKPVDQVIRRLPNASAVLSGNQGYLRTEGGRGRYRTAGELQAFIANRVGDTGQQQTQGQVEINNLLEEGIRRQNAFNLSVTQGNEDRQRSVDALTAESGLYGTALLAEQRRQAVIAAEAELQQKVADANKNLKDGEPPVIIDQKEIDKAKELAGQLFDVQHARDALNAQHDDAQRPIDTIQQQVDLLKQQRELLLSMGEFKAADAVGEQIDALGGKLSDAYDKLIAFYEALSPQDRVQLGIVDTDQLDTIIAKLNQAKGATQEWGRIGPLAGDLVAKAFSGSAADAFTSFIGKIADGQNVFRALGSSVREFAASFISSIAQALTQLLAFAATVHLLRALGVPVPGDVMSSAIFHDGGIAGSPSAPTRQVNPAAFFAAMRYHTGGIAGFAPDEVGAVLKKNEEVLTEDDPRHRFNGGLSGGPSVQIRNVNVLDVDELATNIFKSKTGEKMILNFIQANKRAVTAAID